MSAENACEEASSSTDADSIDSSVECPTCERTDFESKQGMRWHHSVMHGESISGDLVVCEWCETEFRASTTRQQRATRIACSHECKGKLLSKNFNGEDHWSWKEEVEKECSTCGDTIHVSKYRLENFESFYCDKDCRVKDSSFHLTGKDHPSWKDDIHVLVDCDSCGESFETVTYKKRRFCSIDCENDWRSKSQRGENSPLWTGGYDGYYGPNWSKQRHEARKRDHFSCQVCGRDERQLGKIPSCHHVTKLRHYRDNYDAPEWYERGNRLDNLILLCEQHHKKWEGIPLRPQVD